MSSLKCLKAHFILLVLASIAILSIILCEAPPLVLALLLVSAQLALRTLDTQLSKGAIAYLLVHVSVPSAHYCIVYTCIAVIAISTSVRRSDIHHSCNAR